MACDICGKTGVPLVDLMDSYKTSEIAQICPECEKVVNVRLAKIKTVTHNIAADLIKRFMSVLRGSR